MPRCGNAAEEKFSFSEAGDGQCRRHINGYWPLPQAKGERTVQETSPYPPERFNAKDDLTRSRPQ